jgi:hypothetical protein
MPTHAPTGSTSASRLVTAIFERARLARDAHDLHDALVDFGHFRLEQLLDEVRRLARENDHRAARFAVDVLHVRDDAVAGAERLARRLLARRQHALGLS